MLNQLMDNINIKRAQRCVALGLFAFMFSVSCTRDEYIQINDESSRLSIQKIEIDTAQDWSTKSSGNITEENSYVKLRDSLVLYAKVEPLTADTTTIITRGTPAANVNDLTDIRMNLYNSVLSNWTSTMTTTEVLQVSRSGKVYITAPSYNWSSRTDKLTMLTYTPLPSTTNGLSESANGNTVTYTVPTDVTKQPDFCATNAEVDVINNDGLKHLRNLTLYHKFTAVGFSMNGWNAKITKVEISGVAFTGSYALRTAVWTPGSVGLDSRSLGVSVNKVPMDYYSSTPVWTDITRSNGYLMMIPQTLTDKAKVKITYNDYSGKEQVSEALLAEMSSSKWEAGYRITYCVQLETAPSIGTSPITLYMPWKAGYTTTTSLPFVVKDIQDRYTFNWAESWNFIHRGQAKVNNLSGGASSGWYTSTIDNTPIWFFTKDSNPSTSSSRSSVVTLDAWRTVDRTFNVVQGMKPYISVEGMPSTNDLIPAEGANVTVTLKSNYPWESVSSNLTLNPSSGDANMVGQRVSVAIPYGDGSEGVISALFKTINDNKVADLIASVNYDYNRKASLSINPSGPGETIQGKGKSYTTQLTADSHIAWTVKGSAGVTVSPESGTGSKPITITVSQNPSYNVSRNVEAYFYFKGNLVTTWTGRQEKAPDTGVIPRDVLEKAGWPASRLPRTGLQLAMRGDRVQPGGVAQKEDGKRKWRKWSDHLPGTLPGLGTGKSNTALMVGSDFQSAQYCREMGTGWYIPSIDELLLIANNRSYLGPSYQFAFYNQELAVSSTESLNNYHHCWTVIFNVATSSNSYTVHTSVKYATWGVRCVKEI